MKIYAILLIIVLCLAGTAAAAVEENDLNTKPIDRSSYLQPTMKLMAASSSNIVDNGDGTFTYTQIVDERSTAPHYTKPSSGGFEIYSWYNEDYGWMHSFDKYNEPNIVINSVKLEVHAWDVDSEPYHGWDGEYDHLTADGVDMNPVYLQGTDYAWSTTIFDINSAHLMDNGELDIWLDIDMHHNSQYWATTLDYSKLTVTFSYGNNQAPYKPEVDKSPSECVDTEDNLAVSVIGPNPADPNGDAVTYEYRWFVDIGTGGFLDDEFAIGIDHTGSTVPAADTEVGQIWMVQVTPIDSNGVKGPYAEVIFNQIVEDCPNGGEIPEFPTVALPMIAIIGLAFIFHSRRKE